MADVYFRLKGVKMCDVIVDTGRLVRHTLFHMTSQSRDWLHLTRSSIGFHEVARNFAVEGVIFKVICTFIRSIMLICILIRSINLICILIRVGEWLSH